MRGHHSIAVTYISAYVRSKESPSPIRALYYSTESPPHPIQARPYSRTSSSKAYTSADIYVLASSSWKSMRVIVARTSSNATVHRELCSSESSPQSIRVKTSTAEHRRRKVSKRREAERHLAPPKRGRAENVILYKLFKTGSHARNR